MSRIDPLPFRLRIPGQDILDSKGVRSISYRLDGLLHLDDQILALEWTATREIEQVSAKGVRTDLDRSPVGTIEVPTDWITGVRLRRGWWGWRLELRARRIDAFDDVPTAKAGAVTLRIRRRDREHAGAMAQAIDLARARTALAKPEGSPELPRGERGYLDV